MTTDCDVVVIGAGLSGLVAAEQLTRYGLDVTVVEATDRVGGRTLSHRTADGDTVDLGGTFVCDEQSQICALVDRLGLSRFPSPDRGRHLSRVGGRDRIWRGAYPLLGLRQVVDVARIVHRLDALAARPEVQCPPRTAAGALLDAESVHSWLSRFRASERAKELVHTAIRLILASELQEISLLHFLYCLRSAGGFRSFIRTRGRDQQRVTGGAQRICQALTARLGTPPLFNAKLEAIDQDADTVLMCAGDTWVRARRAIVAIPPVAVAQLRFTPALPTLTRGLYHRVRPGSVVKVQLTYSAAFWRKRGLSGKYTSRDGTLSIAMDCSAPGAHNASLMAAAVANSARRLVDRQPDEIRSVILDELARVFGPQARFPRTIDWHNWQQDIAAGGYAGIFGPGVWSTYGQDYRQPWQRVHFAGSETAERFFGSMEGAVCAGQRVATEVLAHEKTFRLDSVSDRSA